MSDRSGVTDFYGFEFSSRSGASTELGRTQRIFKYVLIAVNALFLIFGCVLCALGAYAVNSQAGALAGASLPKAIIALGVFTIILAFLGCFSSFFENRVALSVYFGVLLLICLLSFLIGIGVLVEKNESQSLIIQGWANAGDTAQQTLAEALGCCGFARYCDQCSCSPACTPTPAQCNNCVTPPVSGNSSSPFTLNGWSCPAGSSSSSPVCLTVLQNSFDQYYQQAGGASIAFGVLMFAAMLLVCVLMRAIKQKAYLDSVRAQHKRIREAKEDDGGHAAITMAGLRTGLETTLDSEQTYARATRAVRAGCWQKLRGSAAINSGGRQERSREEHGGGRAGGAGRRRRGRGAGRGRRRGRGGRGAGPGNGGRRRGGGGRGRSHAAASESRACSSKCTTPPTPGSSSCTATARSTHKACGRR